MSNEVVDPNNAIANIKAELAKTSVSGNRRAVEKFSIAAIGVIPWVGGLLAAGASLKIDERGIKKDNLQTLWLEEHEKKWGQLSGTIAEIGKRFDSLGDQIDERIESEKYLSIVRQAFRSWDRAETEEKRKYISNLITNAAGTTLCNDDVVRLFVDWLNLYHEAHFAVIREIFRNPGYTRRDIWIAIHGELVREDSAEADLYKLLIHDLSTGHVIRQFRETDYQGRFIRKPRPPQKGPASPVMKSAFDDEQPYELTELGKQFVHYTMNEVVGRLDGSAPKEAA